MFSLSYSSKSKTENWGGQCSGIWFNTEEEAWGYLDLVAVREYILTATLREDKNRVPRERHIVATTRSYEQYLSDLSATIPLLNKLKK